jgi:hypothetical protein
MAAGVVSRPWEIGDIVALVEAAEARRANGDLTTRNQSERHPFNDSFSAGNSGLAPTGADQISPGPSRRRHDHGRS